MKYQKNWSRSKRYGLGFGSPNSENNKHVGNN